VIAPKIAEKSHSRTWSRPNNTVGLDILHKKVVAFRISVKICNGINEFYDENKKAMELALKMLTSPW